MEYVRSGPALKVSPVGCMTYGTPSRAVGARRSRQPAFHPRGPRSGHPTSSTTPPTRSLLGESEAVLNHLRCAISSARRRRGDRHQGVLPDERPAGTTAVGRASTSWPASTRRLLRRLGTDYVDLYIHRFDPRCAESRKPWVLDTVIARRQGTLLHRRFVDARLAVHEAAGLPAGQRPLACFVSMQNSLQLAYREEEREMPAAVPRPGIAVTPWSPLAPCLFVGWRACGSGTARDATDTLATAQVQPAGHGSGHRFGGAARRRCPRCAGGAGRHRLGGQPAGHRRPADRCLQAPSPGRRGGRHRPKPMT